MLKSTKALIHAFVKYEYDTFSPSSQITQSYKLFPANALTKALRVVCHASVEANCNKNITVRDVYACSIHDSVRV